METDPIIEEVRRLRESYAAQFDFDIDALVEDLEKQKAKTTQKVVTLRPRRPSIGGSSAA